MVSEIRGTAALVLNSFGVFSHYAGTQKGGGSESAIIHHGFRWGVWTPLGWHKCIVLCVCHPTVKFYIKNWGYNRHKLENSGYEWNYKLSKWKWLRFEKLHMFQWKVSPSKYPTDRSLGIWGLPQFFSHGTYLNPAHWWSDCMNMCTSVVYDKNQYLLNIKCAPNEILLSVLSSAGIIYERGIRLPKVCLKLGCIYIYVC